MDAESGVVSPPYIILGSVFERWLAIRYYVRSAHVSALALQSY